MTIQRLVDRRPETVDPMVAYGRQQGYAAVLDASAWTMDNVPAPDVTDKETVLNMATVSALGRHLTLRNVVVLEKHIGDNSANLMSTNAYSPTLIGHDIINTFIPSMASRFQSVTSK